jgi:hypothetical protein
MNQTLEQYLHVYCNYQQDNWADLLPITEFAYNNALNATTGFSLFFTNKGYHLNISIHPEKALASSCTHDFITNFDELHQYLQDTISAAQKDTRFPLTIAVLRLQISRLEKRCSSKWNIFRLHDHQRSYPKNILVHLTLSPMQVAGPLPYDYLITSDPFIQFSTSLCLNL